MTRIANVSICKFTERVTWAPCPCGKVVTTERLTFAPCPFQVRHPHFRVRPERLHQQPGPLYANGVGPRGPRHRLRGMPFVRSGCPFKRRVAVAAHLQQPHEFFLTPPCHFPDCTRLPFRLLFLVVVFCDGACSLFLHVEE